MNPAAPSPYAHLERRIPWRPLPASWLTWSDFGSILSGGDPTIDANGRIKATLIATATKAGSRQGVLGWRSVADLEARLGLPSGALGGRGGYALACRITQEADDDGAAVVVGAGFTNTNDNANTPAVYGLTKSGGNHLLATVNATGITTVPDDVNDAIVTLTQRNGPTSGALVLVNFSADAVAGNVEHMNTNAIGIQSGYFAVHLGYNAAAGGTVNLGALGYKVEIAPLDRRGLWN